MDSPVVFADAFERIRSLLVEIVDGLSEEHLAVRLEGSGNSIAWLAWHLARIQDDHVAGAFGVEQVWVRDGWYERMNLPLAIGNTGFGNSTEQVSSVRAPAELLIGYHEAVCGQTLRMLSSLPVSRLDDIVDENYDPPVSLGVRLMSVISDDLQHLGQAAFIRGLLPSA
jgi:hypothetical protein